MTKEEASLFWDFCNYTDLQFKKHNIVRKYTGEPYFFHCVEVYVILYNEGLADFITACIAVGHDLLEDIPGLTTDKLQDDISKMGFSYDETNYIINGIHNLTDEYTREKYPDANRQLRKSLEAIRLSKIHPAIQNIKLADLISNTKSILQYDEKFAKVYLQEKQNILGIMVAGKPELYQRAKQQVEDGIEFLEKKLEKNLEMI